MDLPQNLKESLQLVEVDPPVDSNFKGPQNLYFSQKPNEKGKGGPIDLNSVKKILRKCVVSTFAKVDV